MSDKTKAILISIATLALILSSLAIMSLYCDYRANNQSERIQMNQQIVTAKKSRDSLEVYYEKNNGRLPVNPIPDEIKKYKSFDLKTIRIEK